MVEAIRTAEKALGEVNYEITKQETKSRVFRRSLFVVKDVKAGVFAELGEGTDMDIPAIMKSLQSTGYNGWLIAEDEVIDIPPPLSLIGQTTRSPMETANNSRKYLDALL